jgi:predicted DCC family thiol-disulfide oxidoreductase YuxK
VDSLTSPPPQTGAGAEAPGAARRAPDALWVFDGVCRFCSTSVRLVTRLDRRGVIRFTSIQSPYGRSLCERYGVDPDVPSTFIFFDRGRALLSSDAVLALLRRLPAPWRWLRVLGVIPRRWRDRGYAWLARNRYRLFGRTATCMTPAPELRARFIDATPGAD